MILEVHETFEEFSNQCIQRQQVVLKTDHKDFTSTDTYYMCPLNPGLCTIDRCRRCIEKKGE